MGKAEDVAQELVALVRLRYSEWKGVEDPRFRKEEIEYKRAASDKAREVFGQEPALRSLAGEPLQVIANLKRMAQATNLLFRSTRQGDLKIFFDAEASDLSAPLGSTLLDYLKYDSSTDALNLLDQFTEDSKLPFRWAFLTYFRFLLRPDQDFFVKPTVTEWLCKRLDVPWDANARPSSAAYSLLLRGLKPLKLELGPFGVRDWIDFQSVIWVAYDVEQEIADEVIRRVIPPTKSTVAPIKSPTSAKKNTASPLQPDAKAPFSERSFKLLSELEEQPTKEFLQDHRFELHQEVEDRFQALFRKAVALLPEEVTSVLETEKNLFARFAKNDWGRGGAWPHYWGALYPRGQRRIESAQLHASVFHDRLEVGFHLGAQLRAEAARFARRWPEFREQLLPGLGELTLQLDEAGKADARAMRVVAANEVLATSAEELAQTMADTWELVFPLLLLAHEEDPAPALSRWFEAPVSEPAPARPPLNLVTHAAAHHFDPAQLATWQDALLIKGQIILSGPPGTGKTYAARQLAELIVAGGDGLLELIQFHPSFAYEDFIEGLRPERRADGQLDYVVRDGRFVSFCQRARATNSPSVLILDEINRTNLARVFGELLYALEYRDEDVVLPSGRHFTVPRQVHVIGTMNSADRSIALVDHAVRRRFRILDLAPDFAMLDRFHAADPQRQQVVAPLREVAAEINDALGNRHQHLGISFFLRTDLVNQLEAIWRQEVEPYLEEYFFDRRGEFERFRWAAVQERLRVRS